MATKTEDFLKQKTQVYFRKNRNERKKQWNGNGGGGVEKKQKNGNGAATELLLQNKRGSFGRQKGRKYAVKTMYDKMGI